MVGFESILLIFERNLYMSIENIILLVLNLMCLIVFAKDFKSGLMISFLLNGGLFMWYYAMEWNYLPALTAFLMYLVLMALSLFAVNKQAQQGGVI